MLIKDPSTYIEVTQEQFDRFKTIARTHGMNISGNSDNVEFDRIPVHVEYKPDAKELILIVHEPHWLAPGVTTGVLHTMVANATAKNAPAVENDHSTAHKKAHPHGK